MNASVGPPDQGLVFRDQLPLPRPYVVPRTPTERRLAEIWRIALSMDRVGMDDAYHDLGGDSFLAAIMFDMIEQAFGIELPLAILASASSIAELAPKIDALAIR